RAERDLGSGSFTPMSKKQSAKADVEQTSASTTVLPEVKQPKLLPPYKVILHNDDVNSIDHVVETIMTLTTLNLDDAVQRTIEAHNSGCALILVTHRERAELYQEQFHSASLTV